MIKQKTHKNCRNCNKLFKLFKTTDKYCSALCKQLDSSGTNEQMKIKPRKSIKCISDKEVERLAKYRVAKKEFWTEWNEKEDYEKVCPVFPNESVCDIHHIKKRIGDLLWDKRYFLAVSRKGHTWIETHPKEAREKGWLI